MSTTNQHKNRFVLLDGHALLFRAYHAMPTFTAPDGSPTGAVYGFANVLIRVLKELDPVWAAACFDAPGATFRDALYEPYKATRAETPSDLILQEEPTMRVLKSFAIPVYQQAGVEADDLIGTFVKQIIEDSELEDQVDEIVIVTGDRDLLQLARDRVVFYLLRRGTKDIELLDHPAVDQLLGIRADQLVDYKALRGDSSDNIPGVPGIGEKSAHLLLRRYETLDEVYAALDRSQGAEFPVSQKQIESLRANKSQAYLSRTLATIKSDVDVVVDANLAKRVHYQRAEAQATLASLGFQGMLKRLPHDRTRTQDSLF